MTEFFKVSDAPGEAPEALVVNPQRLAESELPEGVEPNKTILTPLDEAGRQKLRVETGTSGRFDQKPGVEIFSPTIDVAGWRATGSRIGSIPIGVVTMRNARRRSQLS